jgi:ATP-dependent DNA helicase RecQ
VSWEGVDRGLFEELRAWRRTKAAERGLPPFVIFSDATLRSLARCRPSSVAGLLQVHGIGQVKAAEHGDEVVQLVSEYARRHGVTVDVFDSAARPQPRPSAADTSSSVAKQRAYQLFLQGKSIDEVCQAVDRARSTTSQYLTDLIAEQGISDPTVWLDAELFDRIRAAAKQHGVDRLKPLFEAFGGTVSYDDLRIAVACLRNSPPEEQPQIVASGVREHADGANSAE